MMALGFEFTIAGLSFALTLVCTLITIHRLNALGFVDSDVHKAGRPKRPAFGGIGIVLGLGVTLLSAFAYTLHWDWLFVLLALLVSAAVGLWDDRHGLQPLEKGVLTALAAIPLLWFIPLKIELIALLFLAVVLLSNATNMLAGLNGVESGLGLIIAGFMAYHSAGSARILLLLLGASLLAFLVFNKYPARVFPGDVGTLPIGTMLVAAALLGAPLLPLGIMLIPYFADIGLKLFTAGLMTRSDYEPSRVDSEGYLHAGAGYQSVLKFIMNIKPLKEWQVVMILWILEITLGGVTLLL